MKTKYNCTHCQKEFYRYSSTVRNQNKVFCCKEHYSKYLETSMLGERNPNFSNKWNSSQRENLSQQLKKRFEDPQARWNAGKSNRGKKLSKETIENMHKNRTKESYIRSHSEETKKKIGEKSKEKFTPEFLEKQRKIFEEKGYWIPLEDKTDYEIYMKESNWIERMWDLITDEKQLSLLKEKGIFNSFTNSGGVVRDHMFSRISGFQKRIFPEILRHPCNCQIITASENVSKSRAKNAIIDSQSFEELILKIKQFSGSWKEQNIVLEKIKEYEEGKKWIRN